MINTNSVKSKPLISPKSHQNAARTSQNMLNRKSIQIENKPRYNTKAALADSV